MEFFSNHLSFFFLLITLLSSCQIHARDSQFFNKIPTTNNNDHIEKEAKVVTPNKDKEPNFMPEDGNSYGVYGHESSDQLPPSTSNLIPNNKYLPKNYNPVAYVSIPDQDNTDETKSMNSEFTTSSTYDDNNNNNQPDNSGSSDDQYYRGDDNDNNNYHEYYNSDNTYDHYYTGDNNEYNNNQYYSGVSTYKNQYHDGGRAGSKVTNSIEPTLNDDSHEYYYNNKDQLQDMSEPRLMDKGYTTNPTVHTNNYSYKTGGRNYYYNNQEQSSNKYSYDANTEKYVKNPYENSREFGNSYDANNELSNYNNNFVNYNHENEVEFQGEEHMP